MEAPSAPEPKYAGLVKSRVNSTSQSLLRLFFMTLLSKYLEKSSFTHCSSTSIAMISPAFHICPHDWLSCLFVFLTTVKCCEI